MARLLSLTLLLAWPALGAPSLQGQGRVWMGVGFDSNASRDFVSAGRGTLVDGYYFGLGSVEGGLVWPAARLFGSYDMAGRKFLLLGTEDLLVQNAQLQALVALGRLFDLGLNAQARDRRGAGRDYSDTSAELQLSFLPDPKLEVTVRGGVHRFWFWPRTTYGYFAPEGSLLVRYRFDRRHSVSVTGHYGPRDYDGDVNDRPETPEDESLSGLRRHDAVIAASASYTYRGPFHFSAGYSYSEQTSNSFGESLRRHRVSATLGLKLPERFTFMASGVLQFSFFPDGVFLSPELQVVEDDENSSYVTLKLVRPLTDVLDFDLRYALYINVLPSPTTSFFYMRHVVSVGLTVNF